VIKIGVVATIAYIAAIVALRWNDFHSLEALQKLKLNELGDFLAGVFGPLSFFWLIIGYVQQQKELMLNTRALQLQAEELKNSVAQQRDLVVATRERIAVEMAAVEHAKMQAQVASLQAQRLDHPVFSITYAGCSTRRGEKKTFTLSILNSGRPASNVIFTSLPEIVQIEGSAWFFGSDETKSVSWDNEVSGAAPSELRFIINCKDVNGSHYTKAFNLFLDSKTDRYQINDVSSVFGANT
jgi:hypothetical protein